MRPAIAGDSAGEGLAGLLAEHLATTCKVTDLSRTVAGPEAFHADLSDLLASQVADGTCDRAILVGGVGLSGLTAAVRPCQGSHRPASGLTVSGVRQRGSPG